LPADQNDMNVLVVWDRPGDFRELLAQRFPGVDFEYASSIESVEDVLERLNPEVVFSIKDERFPTETHRLAAAHPGVKWVQIGGSGYEHLGDVDLSRIVLTNSAGVLARFLAETVTGAMLAWNGRFFSYRDQQRARTWQTLPFVPLCEQTLLVVGAGAIGRAVGANARALGMRVLGTNRSGQPAAGIDVMYELQALDRALPEADYVSVHLRLNEQTRHFIDEKKLSAMKTGAFFMNTARGPVVDNAALLEALRDGPLSGAYLDVFDREPLPEDDPLWEMDNVFVTPHAADAVVDWPRRFAEFFADNLERWMRGQEPLNRV